MPDGIKIYNSCTDPCDVLVGPCVCGAWHTAEDWEDKIENHQKIIDNGIRKPGMQV